MALSSTSGMTLGFLEESLEDQVHIPLVIGGVCDLMSPVTGEWDHELVGQTFNTDDAEQILAIPIQERFDDFFGLASWPKVCFLYQS